MSECKWAVFDNRHMPVDPGVHVAPVNRRQNVLVPHRLHGQCECRPEITKYGEWLLIVHRHDN